jgi:AAA15 family ATPase/GTPase
MSRVSIKRIELTDFKGQHEKEILLNGTNAIVAGKNGSGKTTLADSWYWTMADKDYLLKIIQIFDQMMEEIVFLG